MTHHEHHEHQAHKPAPEATPAWVIPAALLVVGLIIGYAAAGLFAPKIAANGTISPAGLSLQDASAKAILLLNQNILEPQGLSAQLLKAEEKDGEYSISFSVIQNGQSIQTIDAFISRNGQTVFPQAINLTEKIAPAANGTAATAPPKTDKPDVLLFIMSYCPYGQQALTTMAPVVSAMGSALSVKMHYVIYDDFCLGGQRCKTEDYCIANGTLCSMHGMNELREDVRQMCVLKYAPDKYWDYSLYVTANCSLTDVEACWKKAAAASGVDEAKISTCQSSEAEALLEAEFQLNQQLGVGGSPTLLINGVDYSGARTPQGYLNGVCSAYNSAPAGCNATLSGIETGTAGGCG